MNLLLADQSSDVGDLEAHGRTGRDVWIALGPGAMGALDRRGTTYSIPEELSDRIEIGQACREQFAQLAASCDRFDEEWMAADAFLRQWKIRPFAFHLDVLGLVADTALATALQFESLRARFSDACVLAVRAGPDQAESPIASPDLVRNDSIWARVLGLPGYQDSVSFVPGRAPDRTSVGFLPRRLVRQHPVFWSAVQSTRLGRFQNAVRHAGVAPAAASGGWMLALGPLREWEALLPWMEEQALGVFFWSESPPGERAVAGQDFAGMAEAFTAHWGLCPRRSPVDFRPILTRHIRWIAGHASAVAKAVIAGLDRVAATRTFRLAIASETATFASRVARAWCKARGIPVVGWQHGAVWYDERVTERFELSDVAHNTVCLTYGEGTTHAYERARLPNPAQLVAVGSAHLDALGETSRRRPARPARRRVVYVIPYSLGSHTYCGFALPISDRLSARAQAVIVDRLAGLAASGTEVTIKLHPEAGASGQNPPWLETARRSPGVRVIEEGFTFARLLEDCDAVIIEVATTTLLESMAAGLPVFVLTSIVRPPPEHVDALTRRAVCRDDPDALMDEVSSWVRDGRYDADLGDREFLRLYGTHLDDGRSAERAQTVLAAWLADPRGGR